ncbi:hypothetical protein GCM10007973_17910 [Polymorphobacter multimanifer]|nr:hypothetical protein GCM10007973_17910 [Polymorphobacter multimanifer]
MMRVLLPLLLLLTAMPAAAQAPARSALGGLDTSAPIDFDADRIEVRDTSNQAVLQGSVEIRQGRMFFARGTVRR